MRTNAFSRIPCHELGMLELKKINAYYGESHILRDVSFTVSAGEWSA